MLSLAIQTPSTLTGESGLGKPAESMERKLPSALTGPLVWTGDTYAEGNVYALDLNRDDIDELDCALKHFKKLDLDEDHISTQTFPLSRLETRLREASIEIHSGRGFVVLKGLDAGHFEVEDSVKIFLGISSYIADQRGRQDKQGNVLVHITSSKTWTVPMNQRHGIHSNLALPYHNDMGCDIHALQARHLAEKGGMTYLSSAWAVFNYLLAREPEVAEALLAPNWPVQMSGRDARFYLAPVFTIHEGKLMANMDLGRFGPHPAFTGNPKPPSLTSAQEYALKRVSAIAREIELAIRLEKGDVLFFNNWALLHRRDEYQDSEDWSRHLVRLWLRNNQIGWSVPESMLPPWIAAYGSEQPVPPIYSLHPVKKYVKPAHALGSAAFVMDDPE